uniref:Uncharacterized protein n=1 Tax=Anopheles minimus TaxID=112268 RepID=A0A182WK04_9DIPT
MSSLLRGPPALCFPKHPNKTGILSCEGSLGFGLQLRLIFTISPLIVPTYSVSSFGEIRIPVNSLRSFPTATSCT